MTANEQLVRSLREAWRLLPVPGSVSDPHESRGQIIATAMKIVPGVDAANIVIVEDGTITSCGPVESAIRALDHLQWELHEGPSVDVIDDAAHGAVVAAQDLSGVDAPRWPHFARRAVDAGYRAVLSSPLTCRGCPGAVLNLYARRPHAFDARARDVAELYAMQAAGVLHLIEQGTNPGRAHETADVTIATATGILMERFAVDEDEAFHLLVHASREQNVEVVDLAHMVRSGRRT